MQTYGTFDQLTIKNDDADLVVREEQWVASSSPISKSPNDPTTHVLFNTMELAFNLGFPNSKGVTAFSSAIINGLIQAVLSNVCSKAQTFTNNFDYTHPSWDNFFTGLEVIEEFVFYRPIEARVMVDEDVKLRCGLHLDGSRGGLSFDTAIVDKIIEALRVLRVERDPAHILNLTPERTNREIKTIRRGSREFIFWEQTQNYLKLFDANIDNPKVL